MLTNLSNLDIEPPSLLFITILSYTHISSIVILFVLLFCSALISGAEVAFFSLNAFDVEEDEAKPSRKILIIKKLLSKPKKLLATILVANNFINIAIVLLFDSLTAVFFSGVSCVVAFLASFFWTNKLAWGVCNFLSFKDPG